MLKKKQQDLIVMAMKDQADMAGIFHSDGEYDPLINFDFAGRGIEAREVVKDSAFGVVSGTRTKG